MARKTVAMWMPVDGLAGVAGETLGQVSDPISHREDATNVKPGPARLRRRIWMPALDGMPPIVLFVLRAAQWFRAKCFSGAKQGAQLRLVGQLTLGAKRHLSLVEVGGLQFLVGGGTEHVTVIVPIPTSIAASAEDAVEIEKELQP
ncbi:MAG TPA: flagellar biosynthetic protein FliO [Acidobacteriaceae bacterium]|nr:flagellar biosynthetic protein FliO [Terriglobia bacterium]HVC91225.1 flagellar biosynthetic protein FliO [Acidobacteriaceae bacterium]